MKRQHVLSMLALAVCAAASSAAFAQNTGTITINGEITNTNCAFSLTGPGLSGNTLTLQSAQVSELSTAGPSGDQQSSPLTFEVSGCDVNTANNSMWVNFSGTNVNESGRITSTTGSANVSFQIRDSDNVTVIKAGDPAGGNGPTTSQGTGVVFSGNNPSKTASKTYWVRYYAEAGLVAADAGPVASTVDYNVYYY